MEIKKVVRSKKTETNGSGWISALLDNVFGSIQMFVEGTVESVHGAAHEFTQGLVRRAFLCVFTLFGVFFLFKGLGDMMSFVYKKPGLGEIVIGIFVLLISWVVYVFNKR